MAMEAHGREDVSDVLRDHALMRTVILHCLDGEWYGGAVFASRVHFDTPERPGRRNVAVIKCRGSPAGAALRKLVESAAEGASGGEALLAISTERGNGGGAAQSVIPAAGAWGPVFERLCREDVAAVFDGAMWLPMRVERCAFGMASRFVGALTHYLESDRERVGDVAPAVEELCENFRGGKMRDHSQLCEALATIMDKHAMTPREFRALAYF